MKTYIITLIFVQMLARSVSGLVDQEPECISQFQTDYKILRKLILMEQEMATLRTTVSSQRDEIKTLKQKQEAMGTTYIRWGRTQCPGNGTSVVYSGFMAGADHKHTGSGSNNLCLSGDPMWGHFEAGIGSAGKITGTEYQFYAHSTNGAASFFGRNIYNHNAPCAVCHSQRSVSMMIPGRNRCYDGWTMEYNGYLVSNYANHPASSEYVCLDIRPESVVNGNGDDGGNVIYFVEGECDKGLACPPYVSGREITCVVCTL